MADFTPDKIKVLIDYDFWLWVFNTTLNNTAVIYAIHGSFAIISGGNWSPAENHQTV